MNTLGVLLTTISGSRNPGGRIPDARARSVHEVGTNISYLRMSASETERGASAAAAICCIQWTRVCDGKAPAP